MCLPTNRCTVQQACGRELLQDLEMFLNLLVCGVKVSLLTEDDVDSERGLVWAAGVNSWNGSVIHVGYNVFGLSRMQSNSVNP